MVPYVWEHLVCERDRADRLAAAVGVDPAIGRLLLLRGIEDPDAADHFLNPSLDQLHDPFRLTDMAPAVERLVRAIEARERIAVHGDYDVDGITATVIVRRTLELLGADVVHFLPERMRDGYGLNTPAIDRLHGEGVRLIVSVDCGVRGMDAARRARELGVDLIVTDHHEPDVHLPDALAVINPKRADCPYPDKNLAGAGVALKLVQALCRRAGKEQWLPALLKIAAIGTIADVVPLLGENRVIARLGLDLLSRGPHKVGLRALLDASGLTGKTIDGYHVSFMIAPRVNAAGRMSTPDIALRLLLATDESMAGEAAALAEQLNVENGRRQAEERVVVAEARRLVEHDPDIGARAVLVVAGEGWHRGVIGIVASKLVDVYHRPAIVVSTDGDQAHGSCRSIPAFDMLGGLEACAHHLVRFGGHRAAAGLTMERSRLKAFREAISVWADERLTPDDLRPRLRVDGQLGFRDITPGLMSGLTRLAPFGIGNPRPVFWTPGAQLADGPRRLKERHLSMSLRHDGVAFRGLFWRAAERAQAIEGARASGLDVAYSVEQNTFRGASYLELTIADLRAAESSGP